MLTLVRDDGVHRLEPCVGGRLGRRHDQASAENVEALILHGTAEVRHRDDVEAVEVVLQPKLVLVPEHAALEAGHGKFAARHVGVLCVDPQVDVAPGAGGVRVLQHRRR